MATTAIPRGDKAARQRWRALWLKVHRWLGLIFLVVLVLVGLTGSVNVYHRLFDEWLSPAFYKPLSEGPQLPLQSLLDKARQADEAPVATLLLPDGGRRVLLVQHRHDTDGHETLWRSSFDVASGQLLGRRDQTNSLFPTLYRLHENLLLKPYWGAELVGISGLVLFISCATGIYLWWPRPGSLWKSVTVRGPSKNWARWMVDWHRVLGFWSCLLMVLVALTGFYLSFPLGVRTVVRWMSPVRTKRAPKVEPGVGPGAGPDEILAVACKARPNDVPIVIDLPNKDNIIWRVALRPKSSHPSVGGLTQLWIDPWRLQVVGELSLDNASSGEWFLAQQFPIHNGALGGEVGRLLVFLSGLALPFLSLSGGFIYFNRWRLQKQAEKARRSPLRTPLAPASLLQVEL